MCRCAVVDTHVMEVECDGGMKPQAGGQLIPHVLVSYSSYAHEGPLTCLL